MRASRLPALVLLVLTAVACGGPAPNATGEEIYLQVCARCHGADLSGGLGPALGADSAAAGRTEEFLSTTVSEGRGRMPSFSQTLTADQIQRVTEYLRRAQGHR